MVCIAQDDWQRWCGGGVQLVAVWSNSLWCDVVQCGSVWFCVVQLFVAWHSVQYCKG